jgi:integrase
MSTPSILNQVNYVLSLLVLNKEQIEAYKARHGVASVKKDLRPGGNPTAQLPAILSVRTKACYLQTGVTFFTRARKLTGRKKLSELMKTETILLTLDTFYQDMAPATLRTVLSMLGKIFLGCKKAGWLTGCSPITPQLREHVHAYRDDGHIRAPRFGYQLDDAPRIIAHLQETGSTFALPAEILLRCGLRLSEVAGLQGKDIDIENLVMHIKGKGGRHRTISIPADLAGRLDTSQQYLFTPNRAWKSGFYAAVRKAVRELGITVSGLHRLRANFAQTEYNALREQGLSEQEARLDVSKKLGHNRVSVTKSYVP